MKNFPFVKQLETVDCGPACLAMITKFYGRRHSIRSLKEKAYQNRDGVSLLGLSDAAEAIGLKTLGVKITFKKLVSEVPLPCIAYWRGNHFVVVYKTTKKKIYVADPAHGRITLSYSEFPKSWIPKNENSEKGRILLLEPTPKFYEFKEEKEKLNLHYLSRQLLSYKKLIFQLALSLFIGTLLQFIFPFLTQAVVDVGINQRDVSFIFLVFGAQLMLFLGQAAVNIIRNWILLHVGTRLNISLISHFLVKLTKLPISFFQKKNIGDLLQRIGDHARIQSFLTGTTLNTLFSLVTFIVFGIILAYYNFMMFFIFLFGSILYISWVWIFLKKRKELDYKRFSLESRDRNHLIQLISGIEEIKLHNSEKTKRWEWEGVQANLYRTGIKSLMVEQFQGSGAGLINEIKNIGISLFAALAVVNGSMTLGMMLAVQYIIGQLNSPINQIISFIQNGQYALISLKRLHEIHSEKDEDETESEKIKTIPETSDIIVQNLTFKYEGPHSPAVLSNINLTIPTGKITAIVGASGSGKTTLLKILLKFYNLNKGKILLNNISLSNFDQRVWREKCGAVLQDGYIFSDTIAKNIALADEKPNYKQLVDAARIANIHEFIEKLPFYYNTKVGIRGVGLSQGQKQRILIARAIYKDPDYLFFDEPTNALDAENEEVIMKNLDEFFEGRTVIIVAHRFSTIRKADKIIVLKDGMVVEVGKHNELVERKSNYYHLMKNQLTLN